MRKCPTNTSIAADSSGNSHRRFIWRALVGQDNEGGRRLCSSEASVAYGAGEGVVPRFGGAGLDGTAGAGGDSARTDSDVGGSNVHTNSRLSALTATSRAEWRTFYSRLPSSSADARCPTHGPRGTRASPHCGRGLRRGGLQYPQAGPRGPRRNASRSE